MSDVIPRGPLHYGEEFERFEELAQAAHRERWVTPRCDLFPQREGDDILVWCFFNRGGPPGKRYKHVPGWLEAFERDLRDGFFLAV